MRVSIDFDVLVTFDCTYGQSSYENGILRVFVEKGLVIPYCKVKSGRDGVSLVKCGKGESHQIEDMFPVHYIYDAARQTEYVEWELVDGFLRARSVGGEWVEYKSKSESSYAMSEFVGGCWFVFEGVAFSYRMVGMYAPDRQSSSGKKEVQEFGSRSCIGPSSREYLLEGVLNIAPGPGWMSWEIYSENFYIDIPDCHA
ncbi:hypothetical protein [Pseudomonas frederiksbergensis]|uniref:hypothetical protein n=1 Tax=Pseudomonas frederiksbergensis TaxID=104087 RepID=UPI0021824848|nr:hypothetical protein [Pseudomonas frederiksbergensis]